MALNIRNAEAKRLAAIQFGEPEYRMLIEAIEGAGEGLMSVANWVEVSIVVNTRHGAEGDLALQRFMQRAGVEIVPLDLEQGRLAREAWQQFGKTDIRVPKPSWNTPESA